MNTEEKVIQIAQLVEEAEADNIKNLFIPILDGFKETPDTDDKKMIAIKDNMLEQFYNDGHLKEGETFEQRIENVQKETFESLPNKELYQGDYFKYYKNYDTDYFTFQVFAQDILVGTKENLSFVRQVNGYFLNSITNEFCQISMSAGRYKVTEEHKLINDIADLEEDEITMALYNALQIIMDNIIYKQ